MHNAIKLDHFFMSELSSDLKHVIITYDKKGTYELYGKYTIVLAESGYYRVKSNVMPKPIDFSTLRNATIWCVLHNERKYREAEKFEMLDLKLCSIETEITIHKRLIKMSNTAESNFIYTVKLQQDRTKRRGILDELTYYINSCKHIQSTRFKKLKRPTF